MARLWLTGVSRRALVQHELLEHAKRHTAADSNQRTASHQSCTTVLAGIVGIRDSPGRQVAQDVRIVELTTPVVSSRDKGSCQRVQQARFRGARSLIEVARVLVQQRG